MWSLSKGSWGVLVLTNIVQVCDGIATPRIWDGTITLVMIQAPTIQASRRHVGLLNPKPEHESIDSCPPPLMGRSE